MKRTSALSAAAAPPRTRPFMKWAGGKSQLLAEILPRLPKLFGRYYEPFVGGGAVFFALQPRKATLSDINGELIEAYQQICTNAQEVIDRLQRLPLGQESFYRIRALQPQTLCAAQRAARLLYLNRTCFNGLYRVNRTGQFNVPFGRYTKPNVCDVANLLRVQKALRGTTLRTQTVEQLKYQCRANDLVYFDPPYDPVSKTASFVGYAKTGFNADAQAKLADLFDRLAGRGVHVVLSNSDTPLIRSLYKRHRIEQVKARRNINSSAGQRGWVPELIIRGG